MKSIERYIFTPAHVFCSANFSVIFLIRLVFILYLVSASRCFLFLYVFEWWIWSILRLAKVGDVQNEENHCLVAIAVDERNGWLSMIEIYAKWKWRILLLVLLHSSLYGIPSIPHHLPRPRERLKLMKLKYCIKYRRELKEK